MPKQVEDITVGNAAAMLGLHGKRFQQTPMSVSELIVMDEFDKRYPAALQDTYPDYRSRAVTRLAKQPFAWTSEGNIKAEIIERYVYVMCPRCGSETNRQRFNWAKYECGACGQVVSLSLPDDFFRCEAYKAELPEEDGGE